MQKKYMTKKLGKFMFMFLQFILPCLLAFMDSHECAPCP